MSVGYLCVSTKSRQIGIDSIVICKVAASSPSPPWIPLISENWTTRLLRSAEDKWNPLIKEKMAGKNPSIIRHHFPIQHRCHSVMGSANSRSYANDRTCSRRGGYGDNCRIKSNEQLEFAAIKSKYPIKIMEFGGFPPVWINLTYCNQ